MIFDLLAGLATFFSTPSAMMWTVVGGITGTIVGALPGVGSSPAIALLLPFCFHLEPVNALILMVGIYLGCMYGGRISSILINVPGEPAAIVTTFDGYPMTKQGKAGHALALSALASFVGGMFGFFGLLFLTSTLSGVALKFGPAEYFSLIFLTLLATCGLTEKKPFKPILSMLFGVLFSCIGIDSVTGQARLTLGLFELWSGVPLVIVAVGIFGMAEVFLLIDEEDGYVNLSDGKSKYSFASLFPTVSDFVSQKWPILRGSLVGFLTGILPGAGAVLSTFTSYSVEKKLSKTPEQFGHGAPAGLTGPEAAANSSVGGALIPTLALGIPGSSSTAVMLGGLMMVGITPGPLLMHESKDIVYVMFASFFVANFLQLFLNTALVPVFTLMIDKSAPYMVPLITIFCFLGAYTLNNSLFDIGIMIFFGVLGYFMRKTRFPVGGFFLGFVLGPMAERYLREALLLSQGSYGIFVTRPVSLVFLLLTAAMFIVPYIRRKVKRQQPA